MTFRKPWLRKVAVFGDVQAYSQIWATSSFIYLHYFTLSTSRVSYRQRRWKNKDRAAGSLAYRTSQKEIVWMRKSKSWNWTIGKSGISNKDGANAKAKKQRSRNWNFPLIRDGANANAKQQRSCSRAPSGFPQKRRCECEGKKPKIVQQRPYREFPAEIVRMREPKSWDCTMSVLRGFQQRWCDREGQKAEISQQVPLGLSQRDCTNSKANKQRLRNKGFYKRRCICERGNCRDCAIGSSGLTTIEKRKSESQVL